MIGYTFKVYLSKSKEHFAFGETEIASSPLTEKDSPFAESLLRLSDLNIWEYEPLMKDMEQALLRFYRTKKPQDAKTILTGLDQLAAVHIYFELLRLDWKFRLERAEKVDGTALLDLLPRKNLTHIPSNIDAIQKQILRLFQNVLLDRDDVKKPIPDRMAAYYCREGSDTLNTFQFQALPLKFELVDSHTFTEILYPETVYDLIDYSVRECVKRKQRMRICKNCGRYFALTGRNTAEYCGRVIDEKGRTCRDMGAIYHWTKSKADDKIFAVYRREYKRRFAWIKAGKISAEELYAWGEKARAKKVECDDGTISLEEYQDWLKNS